MEWCLYGTNWIKDGSIESHISFTVAFVQDSDVFVLVKSSDNALVTFAIPTEFLMNST